MGCLKGGPEGEPSGKGEGVITKEESPPPETPQISPKYVIPLLAPTGLAEIDRWTARSNTILPVWVRRIIILSMIARDARRPNAAPSASISKVFSSKDTFKNTSLHQESRPRQKGSREFHLRLDRYTWSLGTKQLTNTNSTDKKTELI